MELKAISDRIRKVRTHFGLSQPEFARRIDSSKGAIQAYEQGSSAPGFKVLAGIVSEFEISTEWLITGRGEMLIGDKPKPGELGGESATPISMYEPRSTYNFSNQHPSSQEPQTPYSPEELIVAEALHQLGLSESDFSEANLHAFYNQARAEIKSIIWPIKDTIVKVYAEIKGGKNGKNR